MSQGEIIKVLGPLVVAKNVEGARLYDTVSVGHANLLGEIIEVRNNQVSIQVYEETSGLHLYEPVISNHRPLSVELGPGLLSSMLDGIGQSLTTIASANGFYLGRGQQTPTLSREVRWDFHPLIAVGELVNEHQCVGYILEHGYFKHYLFVPKGVSGKVSFVTTEALTVDSDFVKIEQDNQIISVQAVQYWPVRQSRPYKQKLLPEEPLISGQRVIDTFFPVAKGGTACIPGPFGSGKTVVQHQLAKWSDTDVVVYIGCGERGNEMTDVLNEFPSLIDPRTEKPMMHKTVLIANTSNMPVAAREASIYTGMTIAEYYRDMGYHVALMADSTSRWAEALREMSGRLEEMPGDEGYPAYLNSRLASVYERAGYVECLGGENKRGSVTMIGAVSPAGGDLSEPVTQATLQITKVFWALDASLAYRRHFPAIEWLKSYSLYQGVVDKYMRKYVNRYFERYRKDAMILLKEEQQLNEVVQLVGKDSLSDQDLLKLEVARMLREDFFQQNAFQAEDTYTSLKKQAHMLSIIMEFFYTAREALSQDDVYIADVLNLECLHPISRMKFIPEQEMKAFETLHQTMKDEIAYVSKKGGQTY